MNHQTKKFLKRTPIIAASLLLMLVLAACNRATPAPTAAAPTVSVSTATATPAPETSDAEDNPTEKPQVSPTATLIPTEVILPTPTPIAYGPNDFPDNVNPLTGLEVEDPEMLDRAPVLIKVTNFPRSARPHAGLSFADMVFEYYIGTGATRYTALFYGQNTEQAGPMRSARMIDADLTIAFQGVLGFVSADPFVFQHVINNLGNRAISQSNQTCPAICRTGNGDVNSVFADTALVTDFAREERNLSKRKPDLDGLAFDDALQPGGVGGDWVEVQYSTFARSQWRYDEDTGKYLRWIEAIDASENVIMTELVDRLTDEQLAFSNVVVLFAFHNEIKPTLHDIDLLGNVSGQRALAFRDGQVYDLTWRASASDHPFEFRTVDGELFQFKPGNTWFEVVGLNSSVDEFEDGQWEIRFFLP